MSVIEQNLFGAIDIIVDRAISQAGFDKTITALVVECVDEIVGKYKVKYQDSVYYATSDTNSAVYNVNSEVYVLIPQGDFSKEKKILGTVKSLGANYINSIEGDEGYEYIGNNVIGPNKGFELHSHRENDVCVLYDAESDSSEVSIDLEAAQEYIKQSSHLILSAEFKTDLAVEQQNYGNYGLIVVLEFLDDATQNKIDKTYVLDIDNMVGQPYKFKGFSKQEEEFEINGAQFQRIKKIAIFSGGFPKHDEDKQDIPDIFVQNIQIHGAKPIDSAQLDSYYLYLLTPQGTFFSDGDATLTELNLKAEIKIKGKVIDNNLHKTAFYWFKEHSGVDSSHDKYCKHGGQGWECLNDFNIILPVVDEDGKEIEGTGKVEWIQGKDSFIINKADLKAYETKFKCVCVYDDNLTLEKEILIKNKDADYKITIESSEGINFAYDVGSTTLKCDIFDKKENLSYNYYWSKKNNVGNYELLEETVEENILYLEMVNFQSYINNELSLENIYKEQNATIPSEYLLIREYLEEEYSEIFKEKTYTWDILLNYVVSYINDKNITRIEKGVIHNLLVKTITNFATYSCSVFEVDGEGNEDFIGNASIVINNSFEEKPGYSLVIHNGNQVFKYNEAGVSPTHESNENPQEIKTLSFTMFDEKGQAVDEEVIRRSCKVTWTIAESDTMIQPVTQGDDTLVYAFNINPTFNVHRDKNDIELEVVYKEKVLKARTNFTFLKDGDSGTNGTDYLCRIVLNAHQEEGVSIPLYPQLTIANNGATMNYKVMKGNAWGADAISYNNWFKVQLWNLGELVYEGIVGDDTYNVKWSILKNKYNKDVTESSFIDVDTNGAFSVNSGVDKAVHAANIVKAIITFEEKEYSATMPVIVEHRVDNNYQLSLVEGSGFRQVLYSSDGTTPKYDSTDLFKVSCYNNEIDLSTSEKVTYIWNTKGQIYNRISNNAGSWENTYLLKDITSKEGVAKNERKMSPSSEYSGQCINVALEVIASINGVEKSRLNIPIHYLLNRYGFAALNSWDGNSIEIKEDGGMILSPQVGAGKKNADNSFTGVLLGTVDDPDDSEAKEKTGLLGYSSGQRSIFLDAETGKAEFGIRDKSRIIIDPSNEVAEIRSGNYSTTGTKGGLLIDFTTPEIKFGTENFSVDKDGFLTAKGGGSIAGWKISDNALTKGGVGISSNNNSNNNHAFWAGGSNSSSEGAPFSVTFGGYLTAKAGTIGGWTIGSSSLSSETTQISSSGFKDTVIGKEITNLRLKIGSNFGVTTNGDLYFNRGEIKTDDLKINNTSVSFETRTFVTSVSPANITFKTETKEYKGLTGTGGGAQLIKYNSSNIREITLDGVGTFYAFSGSPSVYTVTSWDRSDTVVTSITASKPSVSTRTIKYLGVY